MDNFNYRVGLHINPDFVGTIQETGRVLLNPAFIRRHQPVDVSNCVHPSECDSETVTPSAVSIHRHEPHELPERSNMPVRIDLPSHFVSRLPCPATYKSKSIYGTYGTRSARPTMQQNRFKFVAKNSGSVNSSYPHRSTSINTFYSQNTVAGGSFVARPAVLGMAMNKFKYNSSSISKVSGHPVIVTNSMPVNVKQLSDNTSGSQPNRLKISKINNCDGQMIQNPALFIPGSHSAKCSVEVQQRNYKLVSNRKLVHHDSVPVKTAGQVGISHCQTVPHFINIPKAADHAVVKKTTLSQAEAVSYLDVISKNKLIRCQKMMSQTATKNVFLMHGALNEQRIRTQSITAHLISSRYKYVRPPRNSPKQLAAKTIISKYKFSRQLSEEKVGQPSVVGTSSDLKNASDTKKSSKCVDSSLKNYLVTPKPCAIYSRRRSLSSSLNCVKSRYKIVNASRSSKLKTAKCVVSKYKLCRQRNVDSESSQANQGYGKGVQIVQNVHSYAKMDYGLKCRQTPASFACDYKRLPDRRMRNKFKLVDRSEQKGKNITTKFKIIRTRTLSVSSASKKKMTPISRVSLIRKKMLKLSDHFVNIDGTLYQSTKTSLKKQSASKQLETGCGAINSNAIGRSQYKLARMNTCSPVRNSSFSSASLLRSPAGHRNVLIQRQHHCKLVKRNEDCLFFMRFGRCARKEKGDCTYKHDPDKVAICTRFLRGRCPVKNCAFLHRADPDRMPVCSLFLRSSCVRNDCPYRHVNVNPNAPICLQFLKGHCADGQECKKQHVFVCEEFSRLGECSRGKLCPLAHRKGKLKQVKSQAKCMEKLDLSKQQVDSGKNVLGLSVVKPVKKDAVAKCKKTAVKRYFTRQSLSSCSTEDVKETDMTKVDDVNVETDVNIDVNSIEAKRIRLFREVDKMQQLHKALEFGSSIALPQVANCTPQYVKHQSGPWFPPLPQNLPEFIPLSK